MVRPPTRKPSGYQWERRTDQVARRVKGLAGPSEDRETIIRFIETRQDVEAYVEPKTMVHPLSVVLVAADGEWTRLQLASDAFIRDLARKRHLPIHDAAKVGYPDRMRRYKRGGPKPPDEPSQS